MKVFIRTKLGRKCICAASGKVGNRSLIVVGNLNLRTEYTGILNDLGKLRRFVKRRVACLKVAMMNVGVLSPTSTSG